MTDSTSPASLPLLRGGVGGRTVGKAMPRWMARYSSRWRLVDFESVLTDEVIPWGKPAPDTAIGRGLMGTLRPGGTYSLRLRLRVCLCVASWGPLSGVSGESSAVAFPKPVYGLLRDRDSAGPSICEESLRCKLRLDPFRDIAEEVRDKD